MAKLGDLSFFHSVMTEMQATRENLTRLKQARSDSEQRTRMNDLKIEQAELNLKQSRASGRADKFEAQIMEQIIKDMKKAGKANVEVEDNMFEVEHSKQKNKMKGLIGAMGQGINQVQEDNAISSLQASFPGLDVSFEKKIGGVTFKSKKPPKPKTEAEKFTEGFKAAELGQISFDELEKEFPGKRKTIKEQRILGLPEKSQRLLGQIDTEIKEDAKAARKENTISNPEDVIADFLGEIVTNRAQAEKAGHDVDKILDILGVTEQEILDNQSEPKEGFLKKILDTVSSLTILGSIRKAQSIKRE